MCFLMLLMLTFSWSCYGWTYTFSNKTAKPITVTANLRSLKKGTSGQVICQVTIPANQSQSCDTGNQCVQVLHVIQQGALQGQTFNLDSACQNMEFTFGQSQYSSLGMFSLEKKIVQ